jgi:molybdopterin converting factor subunit 1
MNDTPTITVRLRYFAALRESIGAESATLTLPPGATIATVRATLAAQHPAALAILERCVVARNRAFADAATVLAEGDEVVFIPPMAGGS